MQNLYTCNFEAKKKNYTVTQLFVLIKKLHNIYTGGAGL